MSFARAVRGRCLSILVIDDDDDDAMSVNTVAALRSCDVPTTVRVDYVNKQMRRRWAHDCAARRGLDAATVEFALIGDTRTATTVGSARNYALLATCGRLIVMTDDDTVCRWFERKDRQNRTSFKGWTPSDRETLRLVPYATIAEAVADHSDVPLDVFAMHETVLGRSWADLAERNLRDADFAGLALSPALCRDAFAADHRVVLSAVGSLGDCATDWNDYILLTGAASGLVANPDRASEVIKSRQIAVSAVNTTVWNGPVPRLLHCGVDNREMLPPFFPIDRGEDSLYGLLLRSVMPGALTALHPAMILHEPPATDDRSRRGRTFPVPDAAQLLHIPLFGMMAERGGQHCAAAPRLRTTGQRLCALAGVSTNAFACELGADYQRMVSGMASELARRARAQPTAAGDIFRAASDAAYTGEHMDILRRRGPTKPFWRRIQTNVRRYGEVMLAWPEMVADAEGGDPLPRMSVA
jgi:hypothetical protein